MSFTVDTSGFNRMVQSLSKMSGTSVQNVILAETGKILEGCVRRTKVASAQSIRRSVAYRNRTLWQKAQWPPKARGDFVEGKTLGGKVWFLEGRTFYEMTTRRWSNARWARFQAAVSELAAKKTNLSAALLSRGLTAHSWYQIAKALGIDIAVPQYVKNAAPASGRTYADGRAQQFDTADGFFVDIFNSNPFLIRSGGYGILQDSIQARLNHFYIAVRKDVFKDIKARAEQFPGVFIV